MDPVELDTDPCVIRAGATTTLAWQMLWATPDLAAVIWKARAQIRASVESEDVLEEPGCIIADGVVNVPFTAAETTAFTWRAGVIGVEVYDDSVSPEVAYPIAQCPVTVVSEVVR